MGFPDQQKSWLVPLTAKNAYLRAHNCKKENVDSLHVPAI